MNLPCNPFKTGLLALLLAIFLSGCGESAPTAEAPQATADTVAPPAAQTEETEENWPTGEHAIDPGYAAADGSLAPLFEGIGPVDFPLTTDVEMARAYFNQALTFAYGFNHVEAERSFREAARLDPSCGVC